MECVGPFSTRPTANQQSGDGEIERLAPGLKIDSFCKIKLAMKGEVRLSGREVTLHVAVSVPWICVGETVWICRHQIEDHGVQFHSTGSVGWPVCSEIRNTWPIILKTRKCPSAAIGLSDKRSGAAHPQSRSPPAR